MDAMLHFLPLFDWFQLPVFAGEVNYIDFIFSTLQAMLGGIDKGTVEIAGKIIEFIKQYGVLQLLFAIQFSILVINFLLYHDGFEFVASFIKQILIYTVIIVVMNNWRELGFGFVNFSNSLMTAAVGSAAGELLAGNASVTVSSNPVEVLTGMKSAFDDNFKELDKKFDEYRNEISRKAEAARGDASE